MHWRQKVDYWLETLGDEDPLKIDLLKNLSNEKLMEDSFYKDLAFGTGGIRSVMGPGSNRLNVYTVRKSALGLAQYILDQDDDAKTRGVVIAYDSRHLSQEFALEAAKTIGRQGVQVYLFDELRPTPLLSFAVRHLNAYAGIIITASHNPPAYNGIKMYGQDGAQLPPAAVDSMVGYLEQIESELLIEAADEKQLKKSGLLRYIGEKVDLAYIQALRTIQLDKKAQPKDLSIVFTALHGTATKPVKKAFSALGFNDVIFVKEQSFPDGNFSTVKSPNPEDAAAFDMAIQYGKESNSDILLATDPDADRLGVAVKNDLNEYVLLTGNQMGAILIQYMLEQKKLAGNLQEDGCIIKTIVTTELASAIATNYGIKTIDTLTGFKFIAEKINEFKQFNSHTFLFGYEESYGFLIGDFVRDKDAIQAAVFISEAAAYYKNQGKSLYKILTGLFEKFGYYKEETRSITLEGKNGAEQIERIMTSFRDEPPGTINSIPVIKIEDYFKRESLDIVTGEKAEINLPKSDVLKYKLEDGSSICIRPSGTEPKCKFYFAVKGKTAESANERLSELVKAVCNSTCDLALHSI